MGSMDTATSLHRIREATVDTPLQTHSIRVERKFITFDLRENPRGRFLRITEEVSGRRDAVIVPVTGLEDFRAALEKMIEHNKTLPPPP